MGQTPEELEKEIVRARKDLAAKVDSLTGQVRSSVESARNRGARLFGIIFAAIVGLLTLRRLRRRRHKD